MKNRRWKASIPEPLKDFGFTGYYKGLELVRKY